MKGLTDVRAIVLAAGRGVRMKSDIPKVLHSLCGKPLVAHVIDNLREAGIADIIVVVGYGGDEVIKALGPSVRYAWQHEQKGTGHAVMQAKPFIERHRGMVLIASGDVPLISPRTFKAMMGVAQSDGTKAVVLTMTPDSPYGYGRIIRTAEGDLAEIVEERDASDTQKAIREVNTGTYIFHGEYLIPGLSTLSTDNAQGEYYLPDVIGYIRSLGHPVRIVCLEDAFEGSGVNSPEDLQRVERHLKERETR